MVECFCHLIIIRKYVVDRIVLSPSLNTEPVAVKLDSDQFFDEIVGVHHLSGALFNVKPSFGIHLMMIDTLSEEMILDYKILGPNRQLLV